MEEEALPHYRLLQLGAPSTSGVQRNVGFETLEGLVTHHPGNNRHAHLVDGVPRGVENARTRSYGVVGREIQEIETARTDEYRVLRPDQVLLVKDFILEDSRLASGTAGVRDVDVPTPLAGYVGRVDARNGVVDILDRRGGSVILRARHLEPIAVRVGDTVEYGQSLGSQDRTGLPRGAGKHVHFEVDTRYYSLYERYVRDLADGTLAIDPARRGRGLPTPEVADDGVVRIGVTADVVRLVQERLNATGYRDEAGRPFAIDGVYRLAMQPSVIQYQQEHGLAPTGDLDAATLRHLLPHMLPPEVNPADPQHPRLLVETQGRLGISQSEQPPILEQSRSCVRTLDASLAKGYDEASERLACAVAALAREHGLVRVDHVLLSRETATAGAGEYVHVVEGDLKSETLMRAHMRTDLAMNAPVEQSLARLAALEQSQQRATAREVRADLQQQNAQREDQETPRRVMG